MTYPEHDFEYEDSIIEDVELDDYHYVAAIKFNDGLWLGYPKGHALQPMIGDIVRTYGRGFGHPNRGLFLNSEEIYYRTEEQQHQKGLRESEERDQKKRDDYEATGKVALDAQYNSLPPAFQRRIDRRRENNPDFRWDFEEYEMFACTEAILIAQTLKTPEAVEAYRNLPYEEQEEMIPNLSDEHSGNTFGCAVVLAYWFLKDPDGDSVANVGGALSPLVGSEAYGDVEKGDGDG